MIYLYAKINYNTFERVHKFERLSLALALALIGLTKRVTFSWKISLRYYFANITTTVTRGK